MKNQEATQEYKRQVLINHTVHSETYLGYVNGKLTHFVIKYDAETGQYKKVEI